MVETLCLSNTHNTTMQESIRMTYIKLFKRKTPKTQTSVQICAKVQIKELYNIYTA